MKSLSILIVEDEILIANVIKLYLEERGHCVTAIAISYEEAITQYTLNRPDLVLLDIRLYGKKSGIDFSGFLREQENSPPFIFLTSQFDKNILNLALKNKPNGYLTKPIVKETLWTTIETAAQLSGITNNTQAILSDGKQNHQVAVEDILFIKADHVYINIHVINDKVITLRSTLNNILEKINDSSLLLCHRSFIINSRHITKWTQKHLILRDSIKIPVSRSKKEEVFSKINVLK